MSILNLSLKSFLRELVLPRIFPNILYLKDFCSIYIIYSRQLNIIYSFIVIIAGYLLHVGSILARVTMDGVEILLKTRVSESSRHKFTSLFSGLKFI